MKYSVQQHFNKVRLRCLPPSKAKTRDHLNEELVAVSSDCSLIFLYHFDCIEHVVQNLSHSIQSFSF